jgi:hypothetical protein
MAGRDRSNDMLGWLRIIGGVLAVLIGLLWIGQGLDFIGGSGMSGRAQYAVLGAIVALAGLWLLWGAVKARRQS